MLVRQIRALKEGIQKLEAQMSKSGPEMPGHANFESEKKLDSYFGVVPRVSNSNETVNHGRSTKRGAKLGRTTLVQCTLIAIKYSPYLRKFYEGKKARDVGRAKRSLPRRATFWG